MRYKQILPEKLEPKIQEIEKHPPKISGFRMSYLKQIIYWVCTKKEDNGFSYLNMKYLRTQIPQAEQYIKFLLSEGLIERTKGYLPGERSYGYRIASEYESRYIIKTVTDQKLIRKVNEAPRNFARGFKVQNKYIKDFTLDPQAVTFAENTYSGESYNTAIVSINMVNNNEKYSSIDDAGGRFYSNLTNMPSGLRQFVRVKNRYLRANVDIKNSQPYFTIMILTNPGGLVRFAKSKEFAMILKSLKIPDNDDIKLYINLVTKGQFYEYLMPYFEAKGLPCSRADVKKAVMIILFDQNRKRISRAKRIFMKLFPTVHKIFSIVRGSGKGERFPILLQAIEAHVVLKIILPTLNKKHPDIIAFTVHDSLLVTDSPDIVETLMIEELEKFTGYKPILKIDFFSTDHKFSTDFSDIERHEEVRRRREEEKKKRVVYYYDSKTSVIN
ncbi:MAG: hypothetical protein IPJ16_13060 [Bacteroidales bacterium]|nr:hypothetical protein [Bacteroidales bacterium]